MHLCIHAYAATVSPPYWYLYVLWYSQKKERERAREREGEFVMRMHTWSRPCARNCPRGKSLLAHN